MRRSAAATLLLIALAVLALASGPAIATFLTDWYWFRQLGYDVVFSTRFLTKVGLGLGVGACAFVWFWGNLRLAQRGVVPDPVIVRLSDSGRTADVTRLLDRLRVPVAFALSLPFGIAAAGGWLMVRAFLARTPFDITDPVFGRDVGWYVFTLPMISGALDIVLGLVVLSLALVGPVYLLRRDVVVHGRHVRIEPSAQWHLAGLIAVLFVILAADRLWVALPSLVYSTRGPLTGASYADL